MSGELPEGWTLARLEDLADNKRNAFTIGPFGSSLKVADYQASGVPLVFVRDIRAEKFGGPVTKFITPTKAEELAAHSVDPGDLLITKMGEPPGDTAIYPAGRPTGVITADCIKLAPHRCLTSSEFLRLSIRSAFVQRQIVEQTMGVAQQKLSLQRFKQVETPVPPLAEQRRIVEKVEALLEQVNRAKTRLDRVLLVLKKFRQSVLAVACSGELTREWREGRSCIGPQGRRLDHPNDQDLPDLPDSWAWTTFGDLLAELRNGVSPKPSLEPPGIPVLRISAVRAGSVALGDHRYLRDGNSYAPNFSLRNGDLLFTRYNGSLELLGVCGMVRGLDSETLLYPDKLMRARFSTDDVLPEYIELFFGAPQSRTRLLAGAKSSAGQQGISGDDLKKQPIALPPREEQHEIARVVTALLGIAASVAERTTAAMASADKLPQAILAKAFSGELVSTEAELARIEGRSYETAEQLLKRVTTLASPTPVNGKRRASRPRTRQNPA